MDAERLKRTEEIYHAAMEIASAKRLSFLKEVCGEDEELRREVESLLAVDKTSDNLFNTPPESLAAEMFSAPSKRAYLVGRKINQYKILSLVGEGGMGAVYLAQDTKLLRQVALKVLPVETLGDQNRVRRFLHEARAASALNHPHILTIYDIGQAGDLHFIAMEFVAGETLHDLIHRRKTDLQTLLKYLAQTAEGLAKAHGTGIVHRDLKPENIIVSPDGYAKILDFGLAKLVSAESELKRAQQHQSIQGVIMGTLGYMSPEQARGLSEIDARSDVFSFGCILYEAIAGRKPFVGDSTYDALDKIIRGEPEPFAAPAELKKIVDKCLKKQPSERFQTIGEAAELLKKIDLRMNDAAEDKTFLQPPVEPAKTISQKISEERRQATIVFGDLSKISETLEELEPEESSAMMQALFDALEKEIEKGKGRIEKRLNDVFVAVWGTRSVSENDAENAIRAALELQKQTREFAGRNALLLENAEGLLKIGISTGTILYGKSSDTGEFLTSGVAFNIARRLQSAAAGGEIFISHETYRHVRGVFDVAEVAAAEANFKTKVYSVSRAKSRAFRLEKRGVEGIETHLVGRGGELEKMLDGLHTVLEDGEMQIFTVTGEAGLGKSRLLFEFRDRVEMMSETVRVFNARANETMYGLPYSLIRDLFAFRFEIQDDDSPRAAREKFTDGLLKLWRDMPGEVEDAEMKTHFIGQLVGFDFADSPFLKDILSDARQIHARALHYAAQFFDAISRSVPTVVYLDDLHWADTESLDFFEHLARNCVSSRILILEFARPALFERRPLWGEGQTHRTRLDLPLLSKRESRQLVEDILQKMAGGVPQTLRDLIVSNAEGNPFYIEELIKMLIDQNAILAKDDEWFFVESRLDTTKVPATLTGVLQARLDRLSAWEKRVLQRASIIGREFWDKALDDFGSEIDIKTVLESLRRKELLYRHETSVFADASEYLFKHAILRDVTYETVLWNERREWHERTARWLISESGGRAGEYAATIAGHFEKSNNLSETALWFGRAGEQSTKTHAAETAIFYFQKALKLKETGAAVSPRELVRWQDDLGKAFWYRANYADAIKAKREMLALAESLNDKMLQAEAQSFLSALLFESGATRAAVECGMQAVRLARESGESDKAKWLLIYSLYRQSRANIGLGKIPEAVALAEEGLQIAGTLGDKAIGYKGFCYHALGAAYLKIGNFEPAEFYVEREIAAMREVHNVNALATALNSLGEIKRLQGRAEEAIEDYKEAIALARETNNKPGEILIQSNLGGAFVALGDYQTAEKHLRKVVENGSGTGHFMLSETLQFLAESLHYQNKEPEAQKCALESLALAEKCEDPEGIGGAWRVLGQIAAQAGEPLTINEKAFDAAECFEKSLQIFTESGIEAEKAKTLSHFARFERTRGNSEKADAMTDEAREIFLKLKMVYQPSEANSKGFHIQ